MPQIPSTSGYVAKGHVPPPPKFDQELGSAAGARIIELVPELVSRTQAIRVYDRMARNDAVTSVSLRASKVPVLAAEFYFDPVGEDQVALDISEFVEYNIMQALSTPWPYVLLKILKMYQHGNTVLEPVYQQRPWGPKRSMANSKSYTMLRKLAYRPSTTITKIDLDDNGGPLSVTQNAIRQGGKSEEVDIPIEKVIIFPFGDADDLFGESILRSAYPHWFYKNHLYKIDAIQKERHGIGIPDGQMPPGYTEDDKKFFNELLQNLRTNERAFVNRPPGYEVKFLKPEGNLVDVLKSASYHDVAIMLNVMAEFMMLGVGSSSGGGRATSAAQLDIFYKSEYYIANMICAAFNQYLIPNLVLWNFPVTTFPQMKVRNIGQSKDLQMFAAALASMFDKEIITADLPTEQWARRIFEMPLKVGDRPAISPSQIREQILLQGTYGPGGTGGNAVATPGPSGTGNNGKTSTVGPSGGQGNTGKAPNQP